jgi:hypothetical protein
LERAHISKPSAPVLGEVRMSADVSTNCDEGSTIFIGPTEMAPRASAAIDLVRRLGDSYGAHGVLQVALASASIICSSAESTSCVKVVCGDFLEGWRSVVVRRSRSGMRTRSESKRGDLWTVNETE